MAKRNSKGQKSPLFRNKLLLNQWLLSSFGIDPLVEHKVNGKGCPVTDTTRPIHG